MNLTPTFLFFQGDGQQVPPKHWYPITALHSIATHKTLTYMFIIINM